MNVNLLKIENSLLGEWSNAFLLEIVIVIGWILGTKFNRKPILGCGWKASPKRPESHSNRHCFSVTRSPSYWTEFLACRALPSVHVDTQPQPRAWQPDSAGLVNRGRASRGQRTEVPTPPLENVFPIMLPLGQIFSYHLRSLGHFCF